MLAIRGRAMAYLLALVACAGGVALGGVPHADAAPRADREVPSGWTWTDYGRELLAVSCATPAACVAVGSGGAVLHSSTTADVPLGWTFVNLPDAQGIPGNPMSLVGVTCSSTSCLAISARAKTTVTTSSSVYRSTDGGATWTSMGPLPAVTVGTRSTSLASAIACSPDPAATADTRQCYIAGLAGGLWRSSDDGRTWSGLAVPAGAGQSAGFNRIACSAPGTCVVAGSGAPTSSAIIRGDQVTPLPAPATVAQGFSALACESPSRCVGAAGDGGYSILTLDASPTWTARQDFRPKQAGLSLMALECPMPNTCIGIVKDGGTLLRTDSLGQTGSRWAQRPIPLILSTLDCVGMACVGVGKGAAWYASADLASSFTLVNQVAGFDLAVCGGPLGSACVAGGKENIGRSITGGTLWTLPIADRGAFNTKAIRCQNSLSCSFFGQFEVLTTDDMNVYRPRYGPVQSAAGAEAQTCVTDTLCVSVTESVVYTTFDGGRTPWSSNQFAKVRPAGITCLPGVTSPVTCLVANKYNILIGTMSQDATGLPHWLWRYTNADADDIITSIGCVPNARFCVAAGVSGQILTSVGDDLMNWAQQTVPEGVPIGKLPDYASVTCPAAGFCMVGGLQGKQAIVASTTDAFATYSYDTIGEVDGALEVAGFGCESVNRCIAVGNTVLLGVRTPGQVDEGR